MGNPFEGIPSQKIWEGGQDRSNKEEEISPISEEINVLVEKYPGKKITLMVQGLAADKKEILNQTINMLGYEIVALGSLDEEQQVEAIEAIEEFLFGMDPAEIKSAKKRLEYILG
jgi:hypothetical protein